MGKKNKKNNAQVRLGNEIKEASQEPKIDFDTWYAINQHLIPSHHKKEIIRADFNARGLDNTETKDCFDNALALYGVKL